MNVNFVNGKDEREKLFNTIHALKRVRKVSDCVRNMNDEIGTEDQDEV